MSEDLIWWIGAIVLATIIIAALRKKLVASPGFISVAPGVTKTHNVECRFRDGANHHGKLGQDRWSDGQERFSIYLRNLPRGEDPVKLFNENVLVSEFERSGSTFEFRWKGISSEAIPQFEIGEALRIECGGLQLTGVVEAD